jgi:hypothetical protein
VIPGHPCRERQLRDVGDRQWHDVSRTPRRRCSSVNNYEFRRPCQVRGRSSPLALASSRPRSEPGTDLGRSGSAGRSNRAILRRSTAGSSVAREPNVVRFSSTSTTAATKRRRSSTSGQPSANQEQIESLRRACARAAGRHSRAHHRVEDRPRCPRLPAARATIE